MINRRSTAKNAALLSVLRLAAMAIDVRRSLTSREIQNIPSLDAALTNLEQVMKEMGWADDDLHLAKPRNS
jgi:hypothetical protein